MDDSHLCGIPCRRAAGIGANPISPSTDGNLVTPLVDGEEYMATWRRDLLALHSQTDAALYHAGWRFEGMKTRGATTPGGDALDEIGEAKSAGVSPYVLACLNPTCIRFNQPSIRRLRLRGIRTAYLDRRFPPNGCNHQKFSVMRSNGGGSALVGSVDMSKSRWDSPDHLAVNPDRDPKHGKQTHEAAVRVEGPAVSDIEATFRERWNDPSMKLGSLPIFSPKSLIDDRRWDVPSPGKHSVQVLRTYGITPAAFGYSWSPAGEFTVWASHINALTRSSSYIYIEDQYFLPFAWPPCFARDGLSRVTDVVFQLGEAMKRGVDVIVVTTSTVNTSFWGRHQKYQRDVAVNYLRGVGIGGAPGRFLAASLESCGSDIYVHSKLMIVDDEFVSVGSANIAQRSMSIDSELQVGVVDEDNKLAREFRVRLMREHTGMSADCLADPVAAFDHFRASVNERSGHLKPYPVDPLSLYPAVAGSAPPPKGHATLIRYGVDPYAGPLHLR